MQPNGNGPVAAAPAWRTRLSHLSRRVGAIALATGLLAAACAASAAPSDTPSPTARTSSAVASATCANGSITAAGSTALQPLVEAAAKQYRTACSGATIQVQGGGSGTGLTQVLQGAVEIGNSDVTAESKLQPADAAQLMDHAVAKQGWIMVTSSDVTGVSNLTTQQATDIWTCKVTNWKDVGGNDEPIVLVIRPEGSGTRATFKQVVLGGQNECAGQALQEDSNGAVAQAVQQTPGSTSVIGFAYYQDNKAGLKGLELDGIDASVDNMKSGSYTLSAVGHMYTKGEPTDLTKAFIDYMLGPDVQGTLIPGLDYAPVK